MNRGKATPQTWRKYLVTALFIQSQLILHVYPAVPAENRAQETPCPSEDGASTPAPSPPEALLPGAFAEVTTALLAAEKRLAAGQPGDAQRVLETIPGHNTTDETLHLRTRLIQGEIWSQQGEARLATLALESVLQARSLPLPLRARALVALAESKAARGFLLAARQHWLEAHTLYHQAHAAGPAAVCRWKVRNLNLRMGFAPDRTVPSELERHAVATDPIQATRLWLEVLRLQLTLHDYSDAEVSYQTLATYQKCLGHRLLHIQALLTGVEVALQDGSGENLNEEDLSRRLKQTEQLISADESPLLKLRFRNLKTRALQLLSQQQRQRVLAVRLFEALRGKVCPLPRPGVPVSVPPGGGIGSAAATEEGWSCLTLRNGVLDFPGEDDPFRKVRPPADSTLRQLRERFGEDNLAWLRAVLEPGPVTASTLEQFEQALLRAEAQGRMPSDWHDVLISERKTAQEEALSSLALAESLHVPSVDPALLTEQESHIRTAYVAAIRALLPDPGLTNANALAQPATGLTPFMPDDIEKALRFAELARRRSVQPHRTAAPSNPFKAALPPDEGPADDLRSLRMAARRLIEARQAELGEDDTQLRAILQDYLCEEGRWNERPGSPPPCADRQASAPESMDERGDSLEAQRAAVRRMLRVREQQFLEANASLKEHLTAPPGRPLAPPTLAEVQKSLQSSTLMLVFLVSDQDVFRWSITRNSVKATRIQDTPALRQQLEVVLKCARQRAPWTELLDHSRPLARILLADLEPDLPLYSNLVIVPDDILCQLPFELLPVLPPTDPLQAPDHREPAPEPLRGTAQAVAARQTLGFSHAISYAQSLIDWVHHRPVTQKQLEAGPLLLVGNPSPHPWPAEIANITAPLKRGRDSSDLPSTQVELRNIARVRPHRSRVVVLGQEDATEARLRQLDLSQFTILHFATHGLVFTDAPSVSGLALTPRDGFSESGTDNGYLDAYEIRELALSQVALVTLSACETAVSDIRQGAGTESLAQSFLSAGAQRVVASQWVVDDEQTALFMSTFYEQLRKKPVEEALKAARQHLIEAGSSPFAWAPFVLLVGGET